MMTRTPPIPDQHTDAGFDPYAEQWWDPAGPLRTLHAINPLRVRYIGERVTLDQRRLLDVGCGGGLLSEAMAGLGAQVTALDISEPLITAARSHARETGLEIDYRCQTAEDFAADNNARYDVITCMELLEHVEAPEGLIRVLAGLLAPGGHLFLSTINRTPMAYLKVIVAAEYITRLVPEHTHQYAMFIRPSELDRWLRRAGLQSRDICGYAYVPGLEYTALVSDLSGNYMVHAVRER